MDRELEWFGASGTTRFDPPDASPKLFGTCYLAADPVTAFVESFADLPIITQDMVDDRCMLEARVPATQKLADMTSPLIVGRWKLDRRISTGDDYETCQAWAHSLRLAGFTGIYYEPRHDPREHLADASSIALFSDPGHQPQMMTSDRDGQIARG